MQIARAAGLHAAPRQRGGHGVGGNAVDLVERRAGGMHVVMTLGIFAGKIEEVHAGENDEEAGQERNGIDRVGRVEALKEDKGCEEGAGCECYIV